MAVCRNFLFTKVQISGERNCTFKSIFSPRGYCGSCSFVSNVVKSSFGMLNCFSSIVQGFSQGGEKEESTVQGWEYSALRTV